MAHRRTSPLQRGCRWGSGQAWTPSSAPRCRTNGGWPSGTHRLGGPRGWCTRPQSVRTRKRSRTWLDVSRDLYLDQAQVGEAGVVTWGERAILIMVMMGGRRRRVSFRQRSSKLRSFSWERNPSNVRTDLSLQAWTASTFLKSFQLVLWRRQDSRFHSYYHHLLLWISCICLRLKPYFPVF